MFRSSQSQWLNPRKEKIAQWSKANLNLTKQNEAPFFSSTKAHGASKLNNSKTSISWSQTARYGIYELCGYSNNLEKNRKTKTASTNDIGLWSQHYCTQESCGLDAATAKAQAGLSWPPPSCRQNWNYSESDACRTCLYCLELYEREHGSVGQMASNCTCGNWWQWLFTIRLKRFCYLTCCWHSCQ